MQDLGVPYTFMTNNGMESEGHRAQRLSESLGLDVPKENMILCHSALKVRKQPTCSDMGHDRLRALQGHLTISLLMFEHVKVSMRCSGISYP